MTITPIPDAWAKLLPLQGATLAAGAHEAGPVPVLGPQDPGTLRSRLRDTAKGKRGEGWACLRRAAAGERMFRIAGGPGAEDLPVIDGVDEFVSKSLVWGLATSETPDGMCWCTVSPQDVADLLDPSMAHLRADCESIGQSSKFTHSHVATKWASAAPKAWAERTAAQAMVERLIAGTEEAKTSAEAGLPLVVQADSVFFVLDDRSDKPVYRGPVGATAVVALARQLWTDKGRPLDVPQPNGRGTKAMSATEIVQTYGRCVTKIAVELHATQPRVDDLTLVRPINRGPLPPPVYDADVEAWLGVLAAHDLDKLKAWIAFARTEDLTANAPALVLLNGAHVGKSLLANGVAAAMGLDAFAPLSQGLGKFGFALSEYPILFSDEGLPSINGRPATEEFRELCTRSSHLIELKGYNERLIVQGAVRIIMAANAPERLFQNRGTLRTDDLAALIRRLLVISVVGPARIAECSRRARALGQHDLNCPVRLARVAGHFRWIQTTWTGPRPEPSAGNLAGELRRGSDAATAALQVLEDASSACAEWIAIDPGSMSGAERGMVWVRPDAWARTCGMESGPLLRAVATYVVRPSGQYRRHPVTGKAPEKGQPEKVRWAGLSLGALLEDGISLDVPRDPG